MEIIGQLYTLYINTSIEEVIHTVKALVLTIQLIMK